LRGVLRPSPFESEHLYAAPWAKAIRKDLGQKKKSGAGGAGCVWGLKESKKEENSPASDHVMTGAKKGKRRGSPERRGVQGDLSLPT